jgi:hypothetical protein
VTSHDREDGLVRGQVGTVVEPLDDNTRKEEKQQKARLELLEHFLEGQPAITEEELQAAHREWHG